ncbi:MAG: N-acetyl-alpha-D-glucosaminyl L-malate synthase BshA [Candidatus Eisenbacteria bacterium]|nr:N-acetyl-alpha-D-glucosaminyl L-malate synthase BshA [Candidatus Latescibacterota bacterium]MBD3302408.1 N-acetyl-alpha-D-glucosaminyl L-malate synthase BshA [Candidatus Eisenbacteria bacterium]
MGTRCPRIGVVCYPSPGGSGIVATELGLAMADRGCAVHFISYAPPVRLRRYAENIQFHQVFTDNYPVFHHPPYTLSLATKLVEVVREHRLDLVHVHYAIPHATCAFLAREMLGEQRIRTVTTLHGTDITLVGVQPAFHTTVRFSIERSDGVTAVSAWLRDRSLEAFELTKEIEVIPNFVDIERFRPDRKPVGLASFRQEGRLVVMHASNFRAVKNLPAVIGTFARIAEALPANLVLVGEGPELPATHAQVQELGLEDRVHFLGMQNAIEDLLVQSDLLLQPSRHESFGLTALEAMACGVPVVTTNQGGTAELIEQDVSGFLADPDDLEGMAGWAIRTLGDPARRRAVAEAARARVVERFDRRRIVDLYLEFYERVLS